MKHVLHRFVKRGTLLVAVLGAVVLGIVVPASASSASGSLAAGNSMCTDQTGSANGVALSGTVTASVTNAGVAWTVRAAKRPGTAELQIFRTARLDISHTPLVANLRGTVFYRLCLTNDSPAAVSFANAAVIARGPATESRSGATTALLSSGGTVCGERIAKSGHLLATSTAPVTWVVRGLSGNGPTPTSKRLLTVTSTSVDATFAPGSSAFLDVCAVDRSPNASSTTKTAIAMQFTAA